MSVFFSIDGSISHLSITFLRANRLQKILKQCIYNNNSEFALHICLNIVLFLLFFVCLLEILT